MAKRAIPYSARNSMLGIFEITILLIVLLIPIGFFNPARQEAFGDGLSFGSFPGEMQSRDVKLFVGFNPLFLAPENKQPRSILFSLSYSNSSETLKNITYDLKIQRGNDVLINDRFYSSSGILRLEAEAPKNVTEPIAIQGSYNEPKSAWEADSNGTVKVSGPFLAKSGLYRIDINVDGVEFRIRSDQSESFTAFLSIGDIYRKGFEHKGIKETIIVRSYYDSVEQLNFDSEEMKFTWSIPFDYNASRISNENDFVMHQEIRIPNSWFESGKLLSQFAGMLNDRPLVNSHITIDPYTSEEYRLVHVVLQKTHIMELIQQEMQNVPSAPLQSLVFSLSLANTTDTGILNQDDNFEVTSSRYLDLNTDTGKILVSTRWDSNDKMDSQFQKKLEIMFIDSVSGAVIAGDVIYDLKISDNQGTLIMLLQDLRAINALDSQLITFPEQNEYGVEVAVRGVVFSDAPEEIDETRNGTAIGIIAIPEFQSIGVMILLAGLVGMAAWAGGRCFNQLP